MKLDLNIKHSCIIGLYDEERKRKQDTEIVVKIDYRYKKDDYLDYKELTDFITDILDREEFKLLEDAVETVASEIISRYSKIESIDVAICKVNILDNAKVFVSIYKENRG